MPKYVFRNNGRDRIDMFAVESRSKETIVGYLEYSERQIGGLPFIEIEQVHVKSELRSLGIGSTLFLQAIHDAIAAHKGIHMHIQPGSAGFYKRFFNTYFNANKVRLFDGGSLSHNIRDDVVLNIPYDSLIHQYKFPRDKGHRSIKMETLVRKSTP